MSKFIKLIKEFPNSPKFGTILYPKSSIYSTNSGNFSLEYSEYEKFKEFFEEQPFDYEILKKEYNEIVSIKRLTDNCIFSIGDEYTNALGIENNPPTIWVCSGFVIENDYNVILLYDTFEKEKCKNASFYCCTKIVK